ncbi:MAG: hypothetical protein L6Q97_23145 [Thermoanaerobaculia bacterium]|nr:hypothetical protein [Thermoanaerobaculia bacterium]
MHTFRRQGSPGFTLVPDPLSPGLDYAKRRELSGALFNMVEDLGFLEARVKTLRDSAEHRAGLVKNKSLKTKLGQYAGKLDALRKTLTETIESKGITGEEKLRAQIGRLYVFTEISDLPPTESTLQRMTFLKGELAKAQAQAETLFGELNALNAGLKKEKMAELSILDKETFVKNYNAPAATGKSGLENLRKLNFRLN